jgi:hypothetical protein
VRTFDRYGRLVTTDEGYEHVQNSPARRWVVDHELGCTPAGISVFVNDHLTMAEINYIDDDTLVIQFNSSERGRALIK